MKNRNKTIIVAAIICLTLLLGGQAIQVTQAILPILIVFGLSLLAGYVTAWLINVFSPPPPGVTADSHLQLFYHAKLNEFLSLTTSLKDECSAIDTMGFYLGRKTEYAAMSYLNNTLYPTYPKYLILNASILPELYGMWVNLIGGYTNSIQDSVRYAQVSFVGSLSALDLKGDSTSLKTGDNDLTLLFGGTVQTQYVHDYTNHTIGYIYVNGTSSDNYAFSNFMVEVTDDVHVYFEDQLKTNNTMFSMTPIGSDKLEGCTLTTGLYKVILEEKATSQSYTYKYETGFFTGALILEWTLANQKQVIGSPSRGDLYTVLNFVDTVPTAYPITVTNSSQCYMNETRITIETAINYANSLSNAYWTTLRNAGIYDISQIPSNLVIPLPDFAFMSNDDLARLSTYEIMAMYLAYLHALGNYFNSTTYQQMTNTTFSFANVTYNNMGVIADGFLYRNESLITNGSLYVQVYADMFLQIGNNTLNSSGLIYNLNDTTCWSYAAGDILNVTALWIRAANGTYYSVTNATITAETIEAYLYNPTPTPPAVPTGSSTGSGSSGLLLILAILVVLILLTRGGGGGNQGTTINVKGSKHYKPKIPFFLNLRPEIKGLR